MRSFFCSSNMIFYSSNCYDTTSWICIHLAHGTRINKFLFEFNFISILIYLKDLCSFYFVIVAVREKKSCLANCFRSQIIQFKFRFDIATDPMTVIHWTNFHRLLLSSTVIGQTNLSMRCHWNCKLQSINFIRL